MIKAYICRKFKKMKKFALILLSSLLLYNCTPEKQPTYLTISGKIENNKDSVLSIFNRQGLVKSIKLNDDGRFKDTLSVDAPEIYTVATSMNNRGPVFLKNGFDITIEANSNNFMESLQFSGKGADNSNFILAQIEQGDKIGNPKNIISLEESSFKNKLASLKKAYDSIFNVYNNLDSSLVVLVKNQNNQVLRFMESEFNKYQTMGKGKPSPTFEKYKDIRGGTKSLSDFKGKYVYIDVWATWCAPCIVQFPYLKELKAEYKNKNIVFVGISTDESRRNGGSWEAAENKWRNFVAEKKLGDVQLWAGQDVKFQQEYQISGIPRFILIDPNGNIVDAEAPRPSDPQLKVLLNSLDL